MQLAWSADVHNLRLKIWRTFRAARVHSAKPTSKEEGVALSAVKTDAAVVVTHHLPQSTLVELSDEERVAYAKRCVDEYRIVLTRAGIATHLRFLGTMPVLYAYLRENR